MSTDMVTKKKFVELVESQRMITKVGLRIFANPSGKITSWLFTSWQLSGFDKC